MTYEETMAAKYAGTAFAILFEQRPVTPQPTTKEIEMMARRKANNAKQNAKRKLNNIKADTKQKANWTI